MSAQTIIHPSVSSMRTKAEVNFVKNADKYLLERFYGIGEGYCAFEQFDSAIVYDIIQSNNCQLLSLIEKEIEETETTVDNNNNYSRDMVQHAEDRLYELWLGEGNAGTKRDFINRALVDEKALWDEIKW